jgi:phage terminase small subunit
MTENVASERETTLTHKQEMLILALLSNKTAQAAARIAGVSEKTAQRWLKLPHVRQAYQEAQKRVFEQALTGLLNHVDTAIGTLARNMTNKRTPPSTQVRAAQIVLEQSLTLYKMNEMEARIAELERMLSGEMI